MSAFHEQFADLLTTWHAFRETRANRRAVEWLADEGLIPDDTADKYQQDHPDPDVP
ncbi:hypothetical protein [Ornithinimicrobium cerasi]|uniref:Uncharacterized protein n=1 Tax=Ornithinimicrobium cerasi TaxID=2248773 RepID=A0A285VAS5_9MICO|nr:hypothetical protein [Ornithinimicrobium cerasi]SOC51067.1 hypothetical protein SAMN05421879_1018 [Ornithinimicrobium cerasi]